MTTDTTMSIDRAINLLSYISETLREGGGFKGRRSQLIGGGQVWRECRDAASVLQSLLTERDALRAERNRYRDALDRIRWKGTDLREVSDEYGDGYRAGVGDCMVIARTALEGQG